ncbi:hypothetical protein JVU11DRAFT_9798 [Chiua virens]|nr:hypothetical protein JVU11DRAFT_9798 [Chiua virens]
MAKGIDVAQITESDRLDPWFEDGNVVLEAKGKYFYVHRGFLSSHSKVLKDMIESPQPRDSEAIERREKSQGTASSRTPF